MSDTLSTGSLRDELDALNTAYLRCIDDDDVESWPDLFTDPCLYKITTRENFDRAMPLGILECRSRGMLLDRVMCYRKVNVYEPQRYHHQLSGLVAERIDDTHVRCRSNYLVVRTMWNGEMSLFSCGQYLDVVTLTADGARFAERIVVQDSRRVDTLLVIPL